MSGLYRGWIWAYWSGLVVGVLVTTDWWWLGILLALGLGFYANHRRVRA